MNTKKSLRLAFGVLILAPAWLLTRVSAGADDSVDPELLAAIQLRDVPVVQRMLGAGANVNWSDEKGLTPLHWAAAAGNADIAQALVDHGAKVDAVDKEGTTALIMAVNGLVVTRSSAPRPTAQQVAETVRIVKLLASHGADLNAATPKGFTALGLAVWSGQREVVRVLLENGADAAAAKGQGSSPLVIAAQIGRADIGEDLITHGANPNAQAHGALPPISWAAQYGDAEFVAMLLSHGGNANAKDTHDKKPLFRTVQSSIYFSATNADSASPLAWFALALRYKSLELRSDEAWTALTRELQGSRLKWHDVAMELIDHGATVGKDEDSDVELMDAVYLGDLPLVTALVDHGANINTARFEESALNAAIGEQRTDIAAFLVERGANVRSVNFNNRTPLHLAAKRIHDPKLIQMILERGAKINAVDQFGDTPLAAAIRTHNDEIAELLRQHGATTPKDEAPNPGGTAAARPIRTLRVPSCGEDFYPDLLRRSGIVGSVVVRVCVGLNDKLDRPIDILNSSGNADLDKAAARCMATGQFEAGMLNGKPITSCKDYKVTFGFRPPPTGLFNR